MCAHICNCVISAECHSLFDDKYNCYHIIVIMNRIVDKKLSINVYLYNNQILEAWNTAWPTALVYSQTNLSSYSHISWSSISGRL